MSNNTYRIKDFVELVSKSVPGELSNEYDRFIGLEHYDSGNPVISRFSDTSLITSSSKEFKANDILIARRNVYLKRAGIVRFDGITSGDSIILRVFDDCFERTGYTKSDVTDFLPWVLNSNHFWAYANKHADGMNSKRISKDMIMEYEFVLNDIQEQRKLDSKLWAAYRLKESYKRLLEATREMVKSQFIEMFGNPMTNNRSWPTKTMSEVAPEDASSTKLEGKVWILNLDMVESQTGHIIGKVYDDSSNLLSVTPFDEGNVLLSKLRPYLNKVVNCNDKGYATTELVALRPDPNVLNKVFFTSLLRGDEFVNYANSIATGTKMPRLPLSNFRKLKCMIPPLALQEQFAAIYEQADKSEFELKKSIDAIDAVIKSLINN